jgi:hypothetical protein
MVSSSSSPFVELASGDEPAVLLGDRDGNVGINRGGGTLPPIYNPHHHLVRVTGNTPLPLLSRRFHLGDADAPCSVLIH